MAHTRNLAEAMKALLEKQSQGLRHLQQQTLSYVQQLHQHNLKFLEEFDRRNQQMLNQMLEVLRDWVDEEEEVSKDDGCDEQHSPADAHQVFDESPSAAEEVVPPLDHFQQPPDPNPLMLVANHFQQATHGGSLMLANPSEKELGLVAEQCLPSQELELSGCIGYCEGMKTTGQGCEVWQEFTLRAHRMERSWLDDLLYCSKLKTRKLLLCGSYDWNWVKSSSLVAFDPGGLLFLFKPAVDTSVRALKGGMDATKLEGGSLSKITAAKAIVEAGITVMGHVGLTFQAISVLGGFRPQGRNVGSAVKVVETTFSLQEAGCFSAVLEYVPSPVVPSPVAAARTSALGIPTTGNGAEAFCSGHVLAYHDLLGMLQRHHQDVISDGNFSQAHPQLSRGDAMWCFLMSDLHVGRASTLEIPLLPLPSVSFGSLSNVEMVHAHIVKTGTHEDSFVMTTLVSIYAKCGTMEYAQQLFDRLPQRNVFGWTGLMTGYVHNSKPEVAIGVFLQILEVGVHPTTYTFGTILSACSSMLLLKLGKQIHAYIIKNSVESETSIGNALYNCSSKGRSLGFAVDAFRRRGEQDVISWTAVISACSDNGEPEMGLST